MEWLALVLWIMLCAFALPLALLGSMAAPAFGLQALAGVAGLALCVLFVAIPGGRVLIWCSAGCALIGALAVMKGAQTILRSDRAVSPVGQSAEEHAATLAGIQGMLFAVAAFSGALAAVGITTVG